MKLRILFLMLTVGLLIGATAGCGSSGGDDSSPTTTNSSSSGGTPDTAAIATGLQKGFLISESRATCVAEKIEGKLSDKAKKAVADADRSKIPSDEVDDVMKELVIAGDDCQ